jgi:hypothetical protein
MLSLFAAIVYFVFFSFFPVRNEDGRIWSGRVIFSLSRNILFSREPSLAAVQKVDSRKGDPGIKKASQEVRDDSVLVAHTCNPDRDQEDRGLRPAQANSSQDHILKILNTKTGLVEWLKW